MLDVVTIGSATQDMYVFSKQFRVHDDPRTLTGKIGFFPFGTKIEVDEMFFEIGGGATNAAYTFKRQGLRVGCVASVGADGAGEHIIATLKRDGIATYLSQEKNQRTAMGIFFVSAAGERTIFIYRGAARGLTFPEIPHAILTKTKWLYVTSLGGDLRLLEKILTSAARHQVSVMVNPGGGEIKANKAKLLKLLGHCAIVQLNREEASFLTGRSYHNLLGILEPLSKHRQTWWVITDGHHGSYSLLDKEAHRVIIKPVRSVDMTGAGDAFGSGLLAGYIRSQGNRQTALTLASRNAAAVVKVMGAKHGLLPRVTLSKLVPIKLTNLYGNN